MTNSRMQILAVDDEPQLRRLLKTSLSAHQYNVIEAGSAKAALALLTDNTYDLVILDLGLPDRSGFEVITEIRRRSAIPIIVLSVRNDEAGKVEALSLGPMIMLQNHSAWPNLSHASVLQCVTACKPKVSRP